MDGAPAKRQFGQPSKPCTTTLISPPRAFVTVSLSAVNWTFRLAWRV